MCYFCRLFVFCDTCKKAFSTSWHQRHWTMSLWMKTWRRFNMLLEESCIFELLSFRRKGRRYRLALFRFFYHYGSMQLVPKFQEFVGSALQKLFWTCFWLFNTELGLVVHLSQPNKIVCNGFIGALDSFSIIVFFVLGNSWGFHFS